MIELSRLKEVRRYDTYVAYICVGRTYKNVGSFKDIESAVEARRQAEALREVSE